MENLNKVYWFYVFMLLNIWYVILLWGLIKDTSIRSRLLRLLAVFFLFKMANSKIVNKSFYDSEGFWRILEQMSSAFPIWFILLLSVLLLVVIYGYIELYKEKTNHNKAL